MDTTAQPNPTDQKPAETPAAPPATTPASDPSPFSSSLPATPVNESAPHHGHAAYYLLALSLLLIGFVMGYFARSAISPSVQNIPATPTEAMQHETPTTVPSAMEPTKEATPSVSVTVKPSGVVASPTAIVSVTKTPIPTAAK